MVDGIPIKPISPAEHRRLDRRIKKKYEKLRRRYPEVGLDFALVRGATFNLDAGKTLGWAGATPLL
jgi:hypothetical protein